jgi:hypothetical protein
MLENGNRANRELSLISGPILIGPVGALLGGIAGWAGRRFRNTQGVEKIEPRPKQGEKIR